MSTPIKQRYDVLVIGGSTAGMSAALAVARSKSSVLLVDSSQPRNAPAHHLHNLLGYDGKQPAEWLTLARQNLEQYKESIQSITGTVTKLDKLVGDDIKNDHLFKAEITIKDQIQTVHARRVVLATGIQDQLEGYPEGVKELWGSLVAHCPFCSGTEYTTASWAVILHPSTGFPTIMAPMFTYMNRQYPMYLFTNANPTLINENDRKAYGANGVIIVDEKIAHVSKNEGKEEGVVIHLENGTTHHVSQVYIKPAMRVTPFVEQLNIAINPMTKFVTVDMFGTTSVQGIHAAGDLVEMRQSLSFALAHGTAAGAGAVFSIAQAEWGRKCAAAGVPVAGPPAAAPAPAPAPAAAAAPAK